MRWMVIACMCALVSDAGADDKANIAAARKAFDVALNGGLDDAPATATGHVGVFPGKLLDGDITMWRFGPPYVGDRKIVASTAGWSGTWGWLAVDLAVSQRPYTVGGSPPAKAQKHRYHVLQVLVADGRGTVAALATMLADARRDDKLPAAKPAGALPGPAANSLAWYLVTPGKIKLAKDAQIAVMGSSEGEVGLGAAPAKKLLASWAKLDLKIVGTPKQIVNNNLGIVVSEVDLTLTGKVVRLRGMIVARQKGSDWEVVALQYGADSDFGDPKIGD